MFDHLECDLSQQLDLSCQRMVLAIAPLCGVTLRL
jgi:hypothetical protein